jgi:hypothetical protein
MSKRKEKEVKIYRAVGRINTGDQVIIDHDMQSVYSVEPAKTGKRCSKCGTEIQANQKLCPKHLLEKKR